MSIFNRHTAYEQLVTEHVDGLLDEAGEAKLRQHLATCASCAVEVREQQAVRTLLTAQPMVAVPRSFALPYAPRQAATDESRETGWLRGMQVATATAALVLVTLVGVNVVDPTGNASPSTDAQALSAVIESSDTQEIAAAEGIPAPEGDGAAPPVARTPDTGFSTSAPSGFAPDGGTPEGVMPEGGVDGGLLKDDDTLALAAPPKELLYAPEAAAAAPVADDDRSALEWALLAASVVTALLALSVVAVTWRVRRSV